MRAMKVLYVFFLNLTILKLLVSAQIDLDGYIRLENTCLYETNSVYGIVPEGSKLSSDASLLTQSGFIDPVTQQWQAVNFLHEDVKVIAIKLCTSLATGSLYGI